MKFWVYTIYDRRGIGPPPDDWLVSWGHHRTEMWFPRTKRPAAISKGDRALFYGTGERGFIAVVEISDDEPQETSQYEEDWDRERFPWVLGHRLLVSKAADRHHVASAESAGINPRQIQRGPHTEITREEYERAVNALVDAGRAMALSG